MFSNLFFAIVVSYLIGSIPFSLIFAKLFTDTDVRQKGSGNVGATNVLVTTGKKRAAILSVFFDILKGFVAVAISKILFGADIYAYTAGLFSIIGHDFPVFLGFKGGKGVAATTGVLIALNPIAIWFCLLIYIVSISISRYLILSSIITIGFIPFILWFLGEGLFGIIFGILAFLLALFVHRNDIIRLLSGKEAKFDRGVA
ncbi:glycerol-3-phosphate 1-O-acyltransferase PlsY [Candidatus Saganbacteria bacterium]|nr:glycerol-3-phosphate 1-O-acyltransferase PlsY [Candidatus Saganbacteria bacterium]